jgi:hypothetical protein
MNEQSKWVVGALALLLGIAPVMKAGAQIKEEYDDRTTADENAPHSRMDTLQQLHMIHVSPHVLAFDANTRSATIELRNRGDHEVQGDVLVLFAYPDWPRGHPADTTIITQDMASLEQRDTIIVEPKPQDHFAGHWISGLPGRVTLAPHQAQRFTVKITPPPNLPAGEYWARIVVSINPQDQHRGKGQDTRQRYALPIKGTLPLLRDSVMVFYRQGALKTGLTFGANSAAEFDKVGYNGPDARDCPHSLWIRLPIHLTGTTHVDGTLLVTYHNLETGETIQVNKFPLSMYRDGVTHWWTHTCWVPPGKYKVTLRFESVQKDFPANQRLPMAPVEYTIPTPFQILHY